VNEVIAFGALTHAMIWLSMAFNVTLIFVVTLEYFIYGKGVWVGGGGKQTKYSMIVCLESN
jgi:hypothetical protein